MKAQSALLNSLVSALESFPSCEKVQIVETISFSESQYRLKIRAALRGAFILQVYCYVNGAHVDYAYQLLRADEPVVRWDNKEHFPNLVSAPHHYHAANGSVQSSRLTGNPEIDLLLVLDYMRTMLKD